VLKNGATPSARSTGSHASCINVVPP